MRESGQTAILLLSCPDQTGLVAAVADFIYQHQGNIIHADQHTDQEEGVFLQRVEFEVGGMDLEREEITGAFGTVAERFGMRWSVRFSDEVPRMAILVSRYGHCLYDLLARWQLEELHTTAPLIISNHPDLRAVSEHFALEYHHLPVSATTREQQESALLEQLDRHDIDLIVLARYMQILSPALVGRYANRIINIHHSFLPAFAGGRPYHQAHERGVKIIGATAHYVTAELDQGPIIEQDVVRVSHRDTVEDMVHKGRDLEKIVLARAVHLHLEHRVLVYGNKTVVFD
jgi:formyltetrahydrofolate deformylase